MSKGYGAVTFGPVNVSLAPNHCVRVTSTETLPWSLGDVLGEAHSMDCHDGLRADRIRHKASGLLAKRRSTAALQNVADIRTPIVRLRCGVRQSFAAFL